jgi:hypothetical protein
LAEVEVMARVIAAQTGREEPVVRSSDLNQVIEVLADVLRVGKLILTEKKPDPNIESAAKEVLLGAITTSLNWVEDRAETPKA